MQIDSMINNSKKNLGKYCIEECKAMCCRKGTLKITKKDYLCFNIEPKEKINSVSLSPCKNLKDNKCLKYDKRPSMCRKFPIYRKENTVFISKECTATMNHFFYKHIYKIKNLGYSVVYF